MYHINENIKVLHRVKIHKHNIQTAHCQDAAPTVFLFVRSGADAGALPLARPVCIDIYTEEKELLFVQSGKYNKSGFIKDVNILVYLGKTPVFY